MTFRQIFFFLFMICFLVTNNASAYDCHYEYTVWNTRLRKSLGPYKVEKWKKDLTPFEKGPYGCTICLEDQVEVKLSNGLSFTICKKVRHTFSTETFSTILEEAIKKKVPIISVLGYRPSKSKGKADGEGLRTEFSNHAFGVALDINEERNGLYGNCIRWSPECVLMKGGHYRPFEDPASLTKDSSLVLVMKKHHMKWGGEIPGVQKDFMHFSPDGY